MPITQRLARTSAELVLIVVGVLIALAAESAWTARGERARERLYLEQLLADVRRNAEELDEAIEEELDYARRARGAMSFLRGERDVGPDALEDALNLRRSAFVPTTATLRALVLYGDVGLLRDPSVRAAVVGTADVFETHMDDLRVLDTSSLETLRDLIVLSWRHMVRSPQGAYAIEIGRILDDPQVGPALQMVEIYNRNRAGLLMRMRESNAELLRLLER